jgi:hypothetical protein
MSADAQMHRDVFEGLWATLGEPPLTEDEAVRVVRRLSRHVLGVVEFGELRIGRFKENGYTCGAAHTNAGAGWRIRVNPALGWRALIAELGAYLEQAYRRETKTGWAGIEKMRVRLTREVIRRGWLSGELAPQPKAPPSKDDALRKRLARIAVLEKQWERKQRRAENAIVKLQREAKRIERRVGQ